MPFGFERQLQKENEECTQKQVNKTFISVTASYMPDGRIVPHSFIFDDSEHNIDKIINCVAGNTLKDTTSGVRYLCQTGSKRFYLYFTGERWYIEL